MADEFKRMRQLIGTTADWAAHNIVLGSGEIGIEKVSSRDVRIKIGDGVNPWSVLAYASSADLINSAVQSALDAKLSLAGGTMTGPLTLSREAASTMEPVTLGQLNSERASVQAALTGLVQRAGDVMTGPLTLRGDPISDLEAAPRQYVDSATEIKVNRSGDTMEGPLHVAGPPVYDTEMVSKAYVDNGPYQTAVGGSAVYAGKVVKLNASGRIDSSLIPAGATYYGTVDLTSIFGLTATYIDGDYYISSHTGTIDSSWSGKIFGNPTDVGAGQYLIHRQGKWDLVGESAGSTQIEGKVNRAGDTMTGKLTMVAASAGGAGLAVLPGVDPTAPVNGDVWIVGDTFKIRAGGATVSVKGVNTGDQTITLSGDVTGSGTSGVAATIAPNAVTVAKMQQIASGSLLGRASAGNGNVEVVPLATLKAVLGLTITDVGGLAAALTGKQDASVELGVIAGLTGTTGLLRKTAAGAWELDTTAYLTAASPALSGTPTTPTQPALDNSNKIASTAYADRAARSIPSNLQVGAGYTLVASDAGKMILADNANPFPITVPPSLFAAGDRVDIIQMGAGQVSFVAGSGFTLLSSGNKLKLAAQYAGATVYFTSPTTGVLIGDIA